MVCSCLNFSFPVPDIGCSRPLFSSFCSSACVFLGSNSQKAFLSVCEERKSHLGLCYKGGWSVITSWQIELMDLRYSWCFEYVSNVCKFSCTPLIKMKAVCQDMALDGLEIYQEKKKYT